MEKTQEEEIQEIRDKMKKLLQDDFEEYNNPYITMEEEGSEDE